MHLDYFCGQLGQSLSALGHVVLWRSLLCTVLVYVSLTATAYCSLVSYIDHNILSMPTPSVSPVIEPGSQSSFETRDPKCDPVATYITVVALCFSYVAYVSESYGHWMRKALRQKCTLKVCLELIRQYTASYPIIWWRAISYHYAKRSKQIACYRNGEHVIMMQDYLERLDTNTSLAAFDFSKFRVEDITRLPHEFNSKPITVVRFYKSFGFSNVDAENEYLAQRSSFLMENESKDDYIDTCEGMNLSDVEFVRKLTLFCDPRPWYISHTIYWIMTLLGFSWFFRMWLKHKTVHVDVTIEKIFCHPIATTPQNANRSPERYTDCQGFEASAAPYHWSHDLNLAVELPPAYSDVLMWEPTETGTIKRKFENKSTQMSRDQSQVSLNTKSIHSAVQSHSSASTSRTKKSMRKSESVKSIGTMFRSPSGFNFSARGRMVNSTSFGHVVDNLDNQTTYCVHFDDEKCRINIANNPLPRFYRQNQVFKHKCESETKEECVNVSLVEPNRMLLSNTAEDNYEETTKSVKKSFSSFSFGLKI